MAYRRLKGPGPNSIYAMRRVPRLTPTAPILYKRDGGSGYLTYEAILSGGQQPTWSYTSTFTPDVSVATGAQPTMTLGSPFGDVFLPSMQTAAIPFTMGFSVAQIRNVAEFINIWESIKIVGVNIKFIPQFAKGEMYASSTVLTPSWVVRTDDDDLVMPGNTTQGIQTMLECSKRRVMSGVKYNKLYVKPKCTAVTANLASGGLVTPTALRVQRQMSPGWEKLINNQSGVGVSAVSDQQYLGVKGYIRNLPGSAGTNFTLNWRVEVSYTFMMKTRV